MSFGAMGPAERAGHGAHRGSLILIRTRAARKCMT
jgi:hypothetical protein